MALKRPLKLTNVVLQTWRCFFGPVGIFNEYVIVYPTANPWCCIDGKKTGGTFLISADGWNLELYGSQMLDSFANIKHGNKPTKIEFAGQIVNVADNPGKTVRNRYGKEIYKHAEHWMNNKMNSGWDEYVSGHFNECKFPGHHGCLNQYKADGSIQFEDQCWIEND